MCVNKGSVSWLPHVHITQLEWIVLQVCQLYGIMCSNGNKRAQMKNQDQRWWTVRINPEEKWASVDMDTRFPSSIKPGFEKHGCIEGDIGTTSS